MAVGFGGCPAVGFAEDCKDRYWIEANATKLSLLGKVRSTGCVDRRDSLGGCPDFLTAHLLISVRSRQFAYLLR
ncbi:MAG: hypothetical protein ACYTAO_12955, partial [Planctomycetota bacterium]